MGSSSTRRGFSFSALTRRVDPSGSNARQSSWPVCAASSTSGLVATSCLAVLAFDGFDASVGDPRVERRHADVEHPGSDRFRHTLADAVKHTFLDPSNPIPIAVTARDVKVDEIVDESSP